MVLRQVLIAAAAVALPLAGQTTSTPRNYVRASAEASVSVRPDQARVALGVFTEAATASEAATRNADATAAVIAALRNVLGAAAEIRTVTYSLSPVYNYPPGGQPALRGFQANNIVEAVISDLSIIGRVIDAAITAGANRVQNLSLGLKDDEPVRVQALTLAARRARQKAEAIAQGINVRLGAIISAEEVSSTAYPPVGRVDTGAGAAATTTPVEAGTLEVRATVTLTLEAQ